MSLSKETRERIEALVKVYPERRTALLPALKLAQADKGLGYLPPPIVAETADLVGVPHAAAYELVEFYTMLHGQPRSPKLVVVCAQLPCALRGANRVLHTLRTDPRMEAKISSGAVEVERTSECFGACHRAPMARVNDAYRENLTPEATEQLIRELVKASAAAPPANGSADGQAPAASARRQRTSHRAPRR